MEHVIALQNVTKKFGTFTAVDDMQLLVNRAEVFGFLGPNGAGKSTTLRMMLSLIQPSSGHIELFGKDLRQHRSDILRRIGCIIEKPDFYRYLSGLDNLRIFGALSQTRDLRRRIDYALELTGLKGREKDKVAAYSHGMKQRLGLAQALLHDPELVILDEPTTGLDPQGIIELRQLILQLRQEGKTVLLSSHILSEIELIADSMAIIYKGKAVVQGKVSELLSAQENLNVRVEVADAEHAAAVVRSTRLAEILRGTAPGVLDFHCRREDIPELLAALCGHGLPVYGVRATRGLEDYFLRITEQSQ